MRGQRFDLPAFLKQHGKLPEELSQFLQESRTTIAEYAQQSGIPLRTVHYHFTRFGVVAFQTPRKATTSFVCEHCQESFERAASPSRQGRNKYCSPRCSNAARRKPFQWEDFRTHGSPFVRSQASLGQYSSIQLGPRQKSFVNRDVVDHFYFREGITTEEASYLYGVLLTDGSVGRGKKGSWYVRLEMKDADVVESVAKALRYCRDLLPCPSRGTQRLVIASPYLFHDLVALGCVPRKTRIAQYPVIAPPLDRHFIRGVVDGDGCWARWSRNLLSLQICGHDALMEGVARRIHAHLGLSPQSVQYPSKWAKHSKMQTFCLFRYNKTDSLLIRDWLYDGASIFGARKHERAFSVPLSYLEEFTTQQLSAHLGVDQTFVKRNLQKHQLPHQKVGPYYHFTEEQVTAWVEFLKQQLRNPRTRLPNKEELAQRWGGSRSELAYSLWKQKSRRSQKRERRHRTKKRRDIE